MQNKLKLALLSLIAALGVISCGGNGSTSGNATQSNTNGDKYIAPSILSPISIDNAGIVPVFGQSSTTSVIYVHNNTSQSISGITYTNKLNTDTLDNDSLATTLFTKFKALFGIQAVANISFLTNDGKAICGTIPAGQSCPLVFNTPIMQDGNSEGSALITASYQFLGKTNNFSQIINYAQVKNLENKGGVFSSGADIYGFGNSTGYATVYLYGSGSDQVYRINELKPSTGGITIIQGDVTGRQLQSSFVQAVEVSADTADSSGYLANLTVKSSIDTGNSSSLAAEVTPFSSFASLVVPSSGAGANLTSGAAPLINAGLTSNPTGTLFIVNSGNLPATLSFPTGGSGLTPNLGNCPVSPSTLAAGGSCTLGFSVNQIGGSQNITLPYTGGITGASPFVKTITWYNGVNGPLLTMNSSLNSFSFNAGSSESALITVTNVGGFNLTNVTAPTPQADSGSGTGTATLLSCTAGGTSLPIGSSCTYVATVSDSSADTNAAMTFYISGNYTNNFGTQTYRRALALRYTSLSVGAPNVSILPSSPSLVIIGDNESFAQVTLTLTNNGTSTATIESSFFSSGSQPYLTIQTDNCINQTLAAGGGQCTVIIKLGPTGTNVQLTGAANYRTAAYGGSVLPGNPQIANATINYTVQADQQNLIIQKVESTNALSGNGISGTPYIFAGSQTAAKRITITYQNAGINPINITGVSNTNSPVGWQLESNTSLSTCYEFPKLLSLNGTCTVTFTNVLGSNVLAISAGIGSSFAVNLTVPTMIFNDSDVPAAQFQVQPTLPTSQFPAAGTTVFATGQQATVTNTVSQSLTGNLVTVQNSLANATGYAPFTITSQFESYFTGTPVLTSGCSFSSANNIVTQTCTLSQVAGVDVESVVYPINPVYTAYESLDFLYTLSPAGQVVTMSTALQQLKLAATWNFVGPTAGFSAGNANYTDLIYSLADNQPYMAYSDGSSGNPANKATVMTYNGTSWSGVGSASGVVSSAGATYTKLAYNPVNQQLYLAYADSSVANRITVMNYNGSTWSLVGTQGFSVGAATYINLAFNPVNKQMYVAYKDAGSANKVTVMTYNGTAWTVVGTAGFSATNEVNYVSLAINPVTGQPYVSFQDTTTLKPSVMMYNGSTWVLVGPIGLTTPSPNGYWTSLAFNPINNQPYVAFALGAGVFSSVMTYNGSTWSYVGAAGSVSGAALAYVNLAFRPNTNVPYVSAINTGGTGGSGPVNWRVGIRSYVASSNQWVDLLPIAGGSITAVQTIFPSLAFDPITNKPAIGYAPGTGGNTSTYTPPVNSNGKATLQSYY